MTAIAPSREAGRATKPKPRPSGVSASAIAAASVSSEVAVNTRSGRLRYAQPQVRMMKMTRICVTIDSTNQAVRKLSASA
jgi:hypothetical protein